MGVMQSSGKKRASARVGDARHSAAEHNCGCEQRPWAVQPRVPGRLHCHLSEGPEGGRSTEAGCSAGRGWTSLCRRLRLRLPSKVDALLRYPAHPPVVFLAVCRVQLRGRGCSKRRVVCQASNTQESAMCAAATGMPCSSGVSVSAAQPAGVAHTQSSRTTGEMRGSTCAASGLAGLAQLGSVSSDCRVAGIRGWGRRGQGGAGVRGWPNRSAVAGADRCAHLPALKRANQAQLPTSQPPGAALKPACAPPRPQAQHSSPPAHLPPHPLVRPPSPPAHLPADQRGNQARLPCTHQAHPPISPPTSAPTWMDVRMEQMLWQGLQWSWMMSRHSVPSLYTCTGTRQGRAGQGIGTGIKGGARTACGPAAQHV